MAVTLKTGEWCEHLRRGRVRLLADAPDPAGCVPVVADDGSYWLVLAEYLTEILKRYVVEVRPPKQGERYFGDHGVICVASGDCESLPAAVIVEWL